MMCLPSGLGLVGPAVAAGGNFPIVLSSAPTGFATAGLTHAVPMPATVNAGDRLLIQFGSSQGGTGATPTAPGPWASLAGGGGGSSGHRWAYFWVNAAGTEGGTTVTVTMNVSSRAACIVHRIQAGTFDAAQAPEIVTLQAITATPDPPSLSPTWGSADTLWIASFTSYDGMVISAYPYTDGQTLARSDPSNTGNGYALSGSCWRHSATGTENPGTFTHNTATASRAATIAVKPI